MGCFASNRTLSPQNVHRTDVIVDYTPIAYNEVLARISFKRKFEPINLEEVWPDNPLHKHINNHSLLTFFHRPQPKKTLNTYVAKCFDPDLHCTRTIVYLCPYRWKLNEASREEYCHELRITHFPELRNLVERMQDSGYSLRVVKKIPGSDKPNPKIFNQDGFLHCVLQCVFQNCDLGLDYKILAMPWILTFGQQGYLDYDFPDIASELSPYGAEGYRICGIFSALVKLPDENRIGNKQRNHLHFILEKMPDRRYRFKQSVFSYQRKLFGGNVELIGDIEDFIYGFTSQGWILGATMKMPWQRGHMGDKIPELLVFQTYSDDVI